MNTMVGGVTGGPCGAGCCRADPVCPQDRGEGFLQRAGRGPRRQADPGSRFGNVPPPACPPPLPRGQPGETSLWGSGVSPDPPGERRSPTRPGHPKALLAEAPLQIHVWGGMKVEEGGRSALLASQVGWRWGFYGNRRV